MLKFTKNQILIVLTLTILVLTAFGTRINNFKHGTETRTIDEMVYYFLGWQLQENITEYNTVKFSKMLLEEKPDLAPLSDYFTKPLFKHPPLFTWIVSRFIHTFGEKTLSGIYVSTLFGVLLIPLVYLLGKIFFNKIVGLFSAFVMWLDPINMICSQKLWMDTTLSFFMVSSLLLYATGIKNGKNLYFILAGITCGLAILTKYTGILVLFIVLAYILCCHTKILRNKTFLASIFIPVLSLIPWAYWNFHVYGTAFLLNQGTIHHFTLNNTRAKILIPFFLIILISVGIKFLLLIFSKNNKDNHNTDEIAASKDVYNDEEHDSIKKHLRLMLGLLFFLTLAKYLRASLTLQHIPYVAWTSGQFNFPLFYFGRLLEFSPLYAFSYLSFFVYPCKKSLDKTFFYISITIIFLFFLSWGSYQSRYILPAIPFLIVLGVQFLGEIGKMILSLKCSKLKILGLSLWVGIGLFIFVKTSYINYWLVSTNNMCYF